MKIDYDKIEETAKEYADIYEPRFRKAARQAFTDGMMSILAALMKESDLEQIAIYSAWKLQMAQKMSDN